MKHSLLKSAASLWLPPRRTDATPRYPVEIWKDGDRGWVVDLPAQLMDEEGQWSDTDTLTVRLDHLPAIMARR